MLKGFRDFLLRGNVVDLAVAVIIGVAFGAVVNSLVTNLLTPLIALAGGVPDFSRIRTGPLLWGNFLNAVLTFLITAAAVFFLAEEVGWRRWTAIERCSVESDSSSPAGFSRRARSTDRQRLRAIV